MRGLATSYLVNFSETMWRWGQWPNHIIIHLQVSELLYSFRTKKTTLSSLLSLGECFLEDLNDPRILYPKVPRKLKQLIEESYIQAAVALQSGTDRDDYRAVPREGEEHPGKARGVRHVVYVLGGDLLLQEVAVRDLGVARGHWELRSEDGQG